MKTIKHEIYDESGLIEVREYQVEEDNIEQEIADKEAQLLQIYNEIQELKNKQN